MLEEIVKYLNLSVAFLPGLIGIYAYRHFSKSIKLFFYYIILSLLTESGLWLLANYHLNNIWLINIFTIAEAVLITAFLIKTSDSRRLRYLLLGLLLTYMMTWIYSNFHLSNLFEFNSGDKFIKGTLMILGCGLTLLNYSSSYQKSLLKDSTFWILTGLLFYFGLTLVIFSTATWVFDDSTMGMQLTWVVHNIIAIITNIFFSIGFICSIPKKSLSY
ncbi:MAG: hypothetical protein DWQ44_09735 [Bacteroidetes bacterium]|nr:MAG: hypothetical protein DWQ39_03525 [Bacteroidota bacterium]REK33330.1 MAG: hypothetical protein DWQ44_09735 [Bacteroidota bacterium]REK49730.1 MAG: hypothetical protein DWQ48_06290 [Bacteroidota bacterium]